jgi:hypothetical protein
MPFPTAPPPTINIVGFAEISFSSERNFPASASRLEPHRGQRKSDISGEETIGGLMNLLFLWV